MTKKEKVAAYKKKYYEENKEKIAISSKKYREKSKEKRKKYLDLLARGNSEIEWFN